MFNEKKIHIFICGFGPGESVYLLWASSFKGAQESKSPQEDALTPRRLSYRHLLTTPGHDSSCEGQSWMVMWCSCGEVVVK